MADRLIRKGTGPTRVQLASAPGNDENGPMGTGINPRVDYVFKRIFADEDNALVLVDLLNAVLQFPAGRVVTGVALMNPFVDRDYAEGKVSVLDVRARDNPGRLFLLEMQQ